MSILTIFIIASDALGSGSIGRGHQLTENGRDDLPRETEAIFQPAALLGRAALEKRVPVAVEFGLIVTVDDEGHRVVERVERPGAHGDEGLTEENEFDDLHR